MNSFLAREVIVVPSVTYAVDDKAFFRNEGAKGTLNRWECFRLRVEGNFGLVKSAPQTLVQRWELAEDLSFSEVASRFPGREMLLQSWQLKHLLFPRDVKGVLQRSIIRGLRQAMVAIRVSDDDALPMPLAEAFLSSHGDPSTSCFNLKVPEARKSFCRGLSFFSVLVKP